MIQWLTMGDTITQLMESVKQSTKNHKKSVRFIHPLQVVAVLAGVAPQATLPAKTVKGVWLMAMVLG
jgi:hypothetical protein